MNDQPIRWQHTYEDAFADVQAADIAKEKNLDNPKQAQRTAADIAHSIDKAGLERGFVLEGTTADADAEIAADQVPPDNWNEVVAHLDEGKPSHISTIGDK